MIGSGNAVNLIGILRVDRVFTNYFLAKEYTSTSTSYELNKIGEKLFAMPESKYPILTKTRKDINLLTQLYDLHAQVLETSENWNQISWAKTFYEVKNYCIFY